MDKYIKAENMLRSGQSFIAGVKYISARGSGKIGQDLEKFLDFLANNVPAEDVTPFVYCKDCGKREERDGHYWCKACGYRCNEEKWFCPVGVRRCPQNEDPG